MRKNATEREIQGKLGNFRANKSYCFEFEIFIYVSFTAFYDIGATMTICSNYNLTSRMFYYDFGD